MRVIHLLLLLSTALPLHNSVAQEKTDQPQETSESSESSEAITKNEAEKDKPSDTENKQPTARKITPPTPVLAQYEADLKKSVNDKIIKPLLVGTEDIITLTQPDMHSSDKGVAILLPDWQQAAVNPKAINFLRQHLPTQGWTTITLQPLSKPENYPSHNEKLTAANTENEQLLADYQKALNNILIAVMEKAADYPGIFIVIAQGNNAANLVNIYQQETALEKPNALILLSAHLLTADDNKMLAQQVAESEVPILDLWLKKDIRWVSHFAKERAMLAKREMKTFYRQRQLTNFASGYYPEQALAREIKGWLTTIGW